MTQISTAEIMHGDGSLEEQLDQLITLTRAIVNWAIATSGNIEHLLCVVSEMAE